MLYLGESLLSPPPPNTDPLSYLSNYKSKNQLHFYNNYKYDLILININQYILTLVTHVIFLLPTLNYPNTDPM